MKVLILGRSFHPDGKETAKLIAESLKPYIEELGSAVEYANYKDLVFDISSDALGLYVGKDHESIENYGTVLMTNWFSHASIRKDIANSVALIAQHKKIRLFNSEALNTRSTSKLSQLVHASIAGLEIARTVFSLDLEKATRYAESIGLQYPLIIKDAQASRGNGNYLVNSFAELMSHSSEHTEKNPFVIQQFINSDGCDYRFFVAGGQVALIIKRTGKDGSHLNNTSAGGSAELVELASINRTVVQDVEKISALLGREVTGIDIMFEKDSNRAVFLEANPIPQIATGSFVDQKLRALANALVLNQEENV